MKACSPKAGSEGKAESPSGSATSYVRLVFREGGISGERSQPVVSSAEVEGAFKRFGVRAAWSRHQDQSDIQINKYIYIYICIYMTFGMFVFTTLLEFNNGQVAPQRLVLPKTTQWK